MSKFIIICEYCGFQEIKEVYVYQKKTMKCLKCNDKNLKFKEITATNVFGYTTEELKEFKNNIDN